MNVFVDANILVSVLNKEYPTFTYTSRILSLADSNEYKIYTTPVCLAIAFYFAEKKYKRIVAKSKVDLLCNHIKIAGIDEKAVQKTLANIAIKDFEDGIEYYSAEEAKCNCIITEDTDDFYFSSIEVLNSNDFFVKYMAGKGRKK